MKNTLAVVAAVMLLAGCPCPFGMSEVCRFECATSRDCADGKVCVHEHAHDANLDLCVEPCDPTSHFVCPDSPLGTACVTDDGEPFCVPH